MWIYIGVAFFFFLSFIYFSCAGWAFSLAAESGGDSVVAVHGLLIAVASLAV